MRSALVILPEAPYPVIGGGPLRTASILEGLAGRFEITAVHFRLSGDPDPARFYPPGLLHASHTLELPVHPKTFLPRLTRNLRRAWLGVPPLIDRFASQNLLPVLTGNHFELIWLEHFWLATYADVLKPHAAKLAINLHNVESAYYTSLAEASPLHHRPLLRHFAAKARDYEKALLPLFDHVVTASVADAERIEHPAITVIPNTIPYHPVPNEQRSDSLAFTGNFAYTPNQQALRWFLSSVWPMLLRRLPDLRLRLIGKEIHYAHSAAPNIDYVGPVEDAVREIAKSRVAIVPLRSGSGTRLKILEAFASSTPVVSTSIGAEGLDAMPGEHFLRADTATSFFHSVLELFENEGGSSRLAESARKLYESRYTWQSAQQILARMDL